MHIPSPRSTKKARIEIIPLIDIIFFLLATFVMVSLSMIKNQGIEVNVPVASTGTKQERENYVSISVDAEGRYFYDKEPASLEQIRNNLETMKLLVDDPKVFINGDAKAEFGKAVAVLDEIRKLGISRVAIETQSP